MRTCDSTHENEDKEMIVLMYNSGMRIGEIAKTLGISPRKVKRILEERGIKVRPGRRPSLPTVTCPRCGAEGRLSVVSRELVSKSSSDLQHHVYVIHTRGRKRKRRRHCYLGQIEQVLQQHPKLIRVMQEHPKLADMLKQLKK